jgi:putative spermidine/putrescine transport system ATP-binding protein
VQVRLDGGQLVGARLADARPGERCIVSVRPERVTVAASAEKLEGTALAAHVVEAIYLGDHLRLRLALEGGAELTVKRPAADGLAGLAPGSEAVVAWQAGNARAFRPEAE